MDQAVIALVSIGVAIILGLVGVVYKSLSAGLEKKVDKELYIKTIASIETAVQGINGTATTLKSVVESVASIHQTFMTLREHEYICKLNNARLENENLRRDAK